MDLYAVLRVPSSIYSSYRRQYCLRGKICSELPQDLSFEVQRPEFSLEPSQQSQKPRNLCQRRKAVNPGQSQRKVHHNRMLCCFVILAGGADMIHSDIPVMLPGKHCFDGVELSKGPACRPCAQGRGISSVVMESLETESVSR